MRTLSDPGTASDVIRRIGSVGPSRMRRWGTFTAHEMLCHVADINETALGVRTVMGTFITYGGTSMSDLLATIDRSRMFVVGTIPDAAEPAAHAMVSRIGDRGAPVFCRRIALPPSGPYSAALCAHRGRPPGDGAACGGRPIWFKSHPDDLQARP